MIAIIPIVIRVAAGALERGAGVAISRWAGGNIAKKYIATQVSKKAIEEARKMSMGESKDWQAAFKKDPGEALRGAASDYVNAEVRDAFAKRPKINEQLIRTYTDTLINRTGDSIVQATKNVTGEPDDLIVQFDPDKLIDRTSSDIISRGLQWSQDKDVIGGDSQLLNRSAIGGGESQVLDRNVIDGGSQQLDRSVIGGGDSVEYKNYQEEKDLTEQVNRISTADVLESAGRSAFYDSFDERKLTYTVIGTNDALAAKVRSPLEALTQKALDVNEG